MSEKSAVMTPVFEGTRYLYHLCSECGGHLTFEQCCNGGVYFYAISCGKCENVKFCPLCGAEIERFSSKAIFEKPIDLKPLDIFAELRLEYERKAKWLFYCYINAEHRHQIEELLPLIESKKISGYYLKSLDLVNMGRRYGVSYQAKAKLIKEFGEERE